MRKHSTFLKERGAIWIFGPNWNDFVLFFRCKSTEIKVPSAELEGEIRCSTVDMFSPDFPADIHCDCGRKYFALRLKVRNLSLQKHQGMPLSALLKSFSFFALYWALWVWF